MLFDFDQSDELITPNIPHVGVHEINPILTSNGLSSLDDNDIYFSSIPSVKIDNQLIIKDQTNETIVNHQQQQQQQQEDLYSSFDFPVLSELSRTDLRIDGIHYDKYLNQVSLPSPPIEVHNSSTSDDSIFYPADDSTSSSTLLWVGEECTVETKTTVEDMMVPPSPPISSAGYSPGRLEKESSRKKSLSTIERKIRKKDQNKTAAEKYRLKKRTEREEIISHHLNLKNQNRELKFELENLTFQLEQFKQLFIDILGIPIPSTISK